MARLSELCRLAGWVLSRDADIVSPGFIDIPLKGRLAFAVDRRNVKLANQAEGIAGVVTTPDLAPEVREELGLAIAEDPARSFLRLHNRLAEAGDFYGPWSATAIDPTASIHPSAHIDETGVVIGAGCEIGARAVVLRGTALAREVRVLPAAVIGGEGFQSLRIDEALLDFHHAGRVEVGERTVVLSNAVIARAVFRQATLIGPDCRIGNGAFVSHNCEIAGGVLVGHGAVIAGNCRVGRDVTIGPGAVCIDRLDIGEGSFITGGAVVVRHVPPGTRVSGNLAMEHRRLVRLQAAGSRA